MWELLRSIWRVPALSVSKLLLPKMGLVVTVRRHALQHQGQPDKVPFGLLRGYRTPSILRVLGESAFLYRASSGRHFTVCRRCVWSAHRSLATRVGVPSRGVLATQTRGLRPRAGVWLPRGHPGPGCQLSPSQRGLPWPPGVAQLPRPMLPVLLTSPCRGLFFPPLLSPLTRY